MKFSWKIGSAFGIPVRLHFTMLLLPWFTYSGEIFAESFGFLIWLASVVLLFGSVLLHELGHALTARRFGIETQDIILTPIGGIARIMRLPESPRQEIAIALAGPLVSIVLAALAFATASPIYLITKSPAIVHGLSSLFYINGILGIFNLIPALPMDGGRVLRGILALKRDHLTATRIAVKVGRSLAVVGAIGAILFLNSSPNILLIAGFIYIMAGTELRHAELKAARERMTREAARSAGARPPWPWNVYEPEAESAPSRPSDGWYQPSAETWPGPADRKWSADSPAKSSNDVIVVKGGKVEILSRKDPDTE